MLDYILKGLWTKAIFITKNHTHVKKVGHTSEFLFTIYWWTWKTNTYLKNCWSGPIKNKLIWIFTMLYFFKKIKENTCRYHYQNLDDMIYSSWDTEWNMLKLVILGHFLPFYPQKTPKNPNFEKWNTLLEISSLYKCVQKVTIIWCMVPEMWSATDKIFCHFGPFFALLPLPPDKPKNQNFEKLKKTPGDIINLHMGTINDNHMMYVS